MSIAHARSMSRMALSTQRTVCGGQWAAENAPTTCTDTWEDNVGFVTLSPTYWTPSTCDHKTVDEFTATLVADYYGPGPTWPYIVASMCQWTTPVGLVVDDYSYVGYAFNSSYDNYILESGSGTSDLLSLKTKRSFPACPSVMWKGKASTDAAPAPTTAWTLNRGLWEITVQVTPSDADANFSTASLCMIPHRRDRFLQRRFNSINNVFAENLIYLNHDMLSTGSRTDTIDLRSAASWTPIVDIEIRRPPGFTWTAGNTAFTLSVTGSKIAS